MKISATASLEQTYDVSPKVEQISCDSLLFYRSEKNYIFRVYYYYYISSTQVMDFWKNLSQILVSHKMADCRM